MNKKIVYLHQYFKTPMEPGGTRSYWFSKRLVEEGYKVLVITSDTKNDKGKNRLVSIDGFEVLYIPNAYDNSMGFVRRLFSFLSFMFKSNLALLKEKDVDLVFATSTPLTIGLPPIIKKIFHSTPYIFEVRDLWPEVPIQMGALRNRAVINMAKYFERLIYKKANHIIALSPGMKKGVVKYEKESKVSMIPNMAKIDKFFSRKVKLEDYRQFDLSPDTFKCIHFGTLGIANGVESILDSAELLKEESSIEFIFIGGGAREVFLKKVCSDKGLNNVRFLGKFNMDDTSKIVNLCQLSIVSFKNLPILYTNSPNKLFDSLSAGKPIIVNSAGWTKKLVEENLCGFYVDPNKPKELVEKIRFLKNNTSKILEEYGDNARKLALNKYDKSILVEEFVEIINNFFMQIK